jgi:hypothetical protein
MNDWAISLRCIILLLTWFDDRVNYCSNENALIKAYFWESEEYTKSQDRLFKFGLFVEEYALNSLNRMKIYLPFKSGGLSGRVYFHCQ